MGVYDIDGRSVVSDSDVIITGDLPKIFITSNTAYNQMVRDTNYKGTFTFVDGKAKMKNVPIKFKLQGSGSLGYAKKNLNITFYSDDTYDTKQKFRFNSWMPVSKVHLKANEFDYSMVRNSVGAIFTYMTMGKNLPQGAKGYIESFPVIAYFNGAYMGCHTLNLPQDGKTYNFTDAQETACTNLAYRCGDTQTEWDDLANWEYRGDEDETANMRAAFTSLLNIMADHTNLTKSIIEAHFDIQTLIAYWTLADIMLAVDSLINNWTLVTWDGTIWYHTWYDMDLIFGLGGNDGYNLSADYNIQLCQQYRYNEFWQKVVSLYGDEIASMYAMLRTNGIDADSIYNLFHDFQSVWGWQNIAKDREVWADDKRNNNEISKTWIENRLAYLDNKYNYVAGS